MELYLTLYSWKFSQYHRKSSKNIYKFFTGEFQYYFFTKLAILCKWGFTLLFKAARGEDGAGEGGGMLLFCCGAARFCSFIVCSLAPLKENQHLQRSIWKQMISLTNIELNPQYRPTWNPAPCADHLAPSNTWRGFRSMFRSACGDRSRWPGVEQRSFPSVFGGKGGASLRGKGCPPFPDWSSPSPLWGSFFASAARSAKRPTSQWVTSLNGAAVGSSCTVEWIKNRWWPHSKVFRVEIGVTN